jgi:ATP/ADP translocase
MLPDDPEPGTPRADYCGAIDHGAPWVAALVALLIAAAAQRLVRNRGWTAVAGVTAILSLVCVALAVTAGALESASTI